MTEDMYMLNAQAWYEKITSTISIFHECLKKKFCELNSSFCNSCLWKKNSLVNAIKKNTDIYILVYNGIIDELCS